MCLDDLKNTELRRYLDKYPEVKQALEKNAEVINYMCKNPSTINSFVDKIIKRENNNSLNADMLLLEFCKDNNLAIPNIDPNSCIGYEHESIGFKWIALAILVVVLLSVFSSFLFYIMKG